MFIGLNGAREIYISRYPLTRNPESTSVYAASLTRDAHPASKIAVS